MVSTSGLSSSVSGMLISDRSSESSVLKRGVAIVIEIINVNIKNDRIVIDER